MTFFGELRVKGILSEEKISGQEKISINIWRGGGANTAEKLSAKTGPQPHQEILR